MNAAILGAVVAGVIYIAITLVDILKQLKIISEQLGSIFRELRNRRPFDPHDPDSDDI